MKKRSQVKRMGDGEIFARIGPGVRENLREIDRLAEVALLGNRPMAPLVATISGIAKATENLLFHLDPENDVS